MPFLILCKNFVYIVCNVYIVYICKKRKCTGNIYTQYTHQFISYTPFLCVKCVMCITKNANVLVIFTHTYTH